jgi:hypothetical protein
MLSMKKIILILALLVPIGIFVFLKFFGKNEFTIPVYYEGGVDNPPAVCNRTYDSPYLVSATTLNTIGWNGRNVLLVADSSGVVQKALLSLEKKISNEIQSLFLKGLEVDQNELLTCDLLLESPWKVVLIDDQRRIRGYYDPSDRDEMDRLVVELKILLKQY